MYDAYEKLESLENVIRMIERCRDELAGMGFFGLENDLDDLMQDVDLERRDLADDIKALNDEQEAEDECEYYAAVI